MMTNGEGRKQHLVFRYRPLDSEDAGGGRGGRAGGAGSGAISATKPLFLTTMNDDTRASGFYRRRSRRHGGAGEDHDDRQAGRRPHQSASDADIVVFTEQDFDVFPIFWVSDTNFATPQKVSDANPQQAEFMWGKSEKIQYTNTDGKMLDAILIKPENFDPTKKYPMMVYIYEGSRRRLHDYWRPNAGTSINATCYVSNGYLVLVPDIVYDDRYPGAERDEVRAAGDSSRGRQGLHRRKGDRHPGPLVGRLSDRVHGDADEPLQGRRSRRAGVEHGQRLRRHPLGHRAAARVPVRKTQSRIGATLWEAPMQFIENSPIFMADRVQTPLMIICTTTPTTRCRGTRASSFTWRSAASARRRYMFNYNGQPHGLRDRDGHEGLDRAHGRVLRPLHDRQAAPDWMDKGVPYLQKGTRDVLGLFKKPVVDRGRRTRAAGASERSHPSS